MFVVTCPFWRSVGRHQGNAAGTVSAMNGSRPRWFSATDVREGRPTRYMLWVLFGSLILTAAALAAVWAWYYGPFAKDQHRMAIHPPGVRKFHNPKPPWWI